MLQTDFPSTKELSERHAAACDLKQIVDHAKIESALLDWVKQIGAPAETKIIFVSSGKEIKKAARDAWDAWDARAARDARDAWAAWAARDAWDAWDARDARDARAAWAAWAAWDAWDARAARDARDARAAWAAWDARAARAAWDASWLSVAAIGAVSINDEKQARIWLPILEAFEAGAFAFFVTDAEILVSTIPAKISVDSERRLHCEDGPAFIWMNDIEDYYWHGVYVDRKIIMNPKTIKVSQIDKEENSEVRRVLIERYKHGEEINGAAAYIRDAGGKRLDHDEQFGTLWERKVPDDETIVMLQVVNSTREPDGSWKTYWLRVDPSCRTAREASAWTFNVPAKDYAPMVET